MKTAIIMVTYNGWPLTENCLADLSGLPSEDFVIAVADNGSTDDTVNHIREKFPHVKIYPQEKNLGFGAANNAAIKALKAEGIEFDTICLLNNDTRLDKNFIVSLRQSLKDAEKLFGKAIVVPAVFNKDETPQHNYFAPIGKLQFFLNAFRSKAAAAKHLEGIPEPCPETTFFKTHWASAVCWMMPSALFESLGGFDEKIFMYYEDYDLAYRAIALGYRFYIQSSCALTHLGGGSAKSSLSRAMQHDRSQEYVFKKHMGRKGAMLSKSFRICRSLLRLVPAFLLAAVNKKHLELAKIHFALLKEAL